jgi:hypothetical protein
VLSFGYPARAGPGSPPTGAVVPPAGLQAARGGRAAPVGALVPATGRYAVHGAQVRAGLELWASRAGTRLVVEDTEASPRARRASMGSWSSGQFQALGLGIVARFSFRDPPAAVAAAGADAILACGPVGAEVMLFRALARLAPTTLRGGVSPALAAFPARPDGDPEGLLAPVQWHPETRTSLELGPSSAELVADAARERARRARLRRRPGLCGRADRRPLPRARRGRPLGAARRLCTTTFFGVFELDPATGLQRGHRPSVVRWGRTRQELLLAEAS